MPPLKVLNEKKFQLKVRGNIQTQNSENIPYMKGFPPRQYLAFHAKVLALKKELPILIKRPLCVRIRS